MTLGENGDIMRIKGRFWAVVAAGFAMAAPADGQQQQPVFPLMHTTKLPEARQMHGSAVVGNRLYVFGGATLKQGWSNDVLSAEILPTAQLGPWKREATALPERRSYICQSVEVINDRIYIIGGNVAPAANTPEKTVLDAQDILWSSVQPDGSLGPWRKSDPFPGVPISCLATSAADNYLYVIGGSSGTDAKRFVSPRILVASIAPDGTPGNWKETAALPKGLWFHGSAIQEDRLYVWGGLHSGNRKDVNPKVLSAQVKGDGTLSEWRDEKQDMPFPVYSSTFCGFNDYLVAAGGRYADAFPTNVIWFGRLEKKQLQPWRYLNTDMDARVYHALGLDKSRGWIFVTGGQKRITREEKTVHLTDSVQVFTLKQPAETRMESVKTGPATSTPTPAATSASGDAPATLTFYRPQDALRLAGQSGKTVLAFFYAPEVPTCRRFWDGVMQSEAFRSFAKNYVLAAVDASKPEGQPWCSRYVVFKVPNFVEIRPDGTMVRKSQAMRTSTDFENFVVGRQ